MLKFFFVESCERDALTYFVVSNLGKWPVSLSSALISNIVYSDTGQQPKILVAVACTTVLSMFPLSDWLFYVEDVDRKRGDQPNGQNR